MHKLIYFLKKIYIPFIFLTVEVMAIYFYSNATPYSFSRLSSVSHYICGWSGSLFTRLGNYLSLKQDNIALNERIAELESLLANYKALYPQTVETELDLSPNMYVPAQVVSKTLNRSLNYIVVNKGIDDNVRIGMSVLSPEGYAVGYITNCSQNFSIAISLLNTSFNVSARLSDDRSMGTVSWQGGDIHTLRMSDISKYANFEAGQRVEAIDFSEYFPGGTILGTVESKEMNDDQTMYSCTLRIAADLSRIDNVILVDNREVEQVRILKQEPVAAPTTLEAVNEDTINQ
ncbi:MAG: rod shape-determining protein MreC [Rikenellaceae bacterium]|nr:rod shape-determining protein MreC [Rikenellaceae bacterium]